MEPVSFIAPGAFRPFVAFAERVGEPLRLPRALARHTAPLPLARLGQLLEEAAAADFGFRAGAASRLEDAPLGWDVHRSLTVGAALSAAAHASSRYVAGQRLYVTQHADEVRVQRSFPVALRRGRRQANDFALQMLIDLVRRGAGPRWRPAKLQLEGPPPGHAEELAALSAGPVSFGAAADCLVFPRTVLALPLPPAAGWARTPSPPLPDVDFLDSIRQTIQCLLELGELKVAHAAEAAGTSVRGLQRSLAMSGVSFSRLVDEARFQAAASLLRDPRLRVIDVSVEVGYTDAANFTRAFRRWAGLSPLAFRRATEPQSETRITGAARGRSRDPSPRPVVGGA